jgi:hypothetical protein
MDSVDTEIPRGLRYIYLATFVFALIFGIAGTFAARLVGDIAGHPVRDMDVNVLMGVAALAFATGSWMAFRSVRWEQVSILTAMLAFGNLFGGLGGMVAYFFPGLFALSEPYPPVQLLVSVVLLLLGAAFTYFYLSHNRLAVLSSGNASSSALAK